VIPEEVINEIKRRADIGAIIGRTVKLKKQGRNFLGLCPFHTEKSPSFNVRPDEGFFYCFGCRAAGDVVEFLVKSSGRGFLDIITDLAAETGVPIPQQTLSAEETQQQKDKKRLLKVCELAQVFFRTRLANDEGRAARAYLADTRKLDEATIDAFGLGFAGLSDRGLREFLTGQGYSVDDGVRAGVLGRGERGEYDFYRQRITIPIRNTRGEVVSFGGRIFGTAAEPWRTPDGTLRTPPKYLNGPQSMIYDKGSMLYGLFEAQPALKAGKPAVLVEGYFDAIAVHRTGLATAVAPCGTSLTQRHVDEIKKRVGEGGRTIVCLDADRAGQEAAAKAILMLLVSDLDAGFVVLPEKDPDQLVQEGRLDELRGLLLGSPGALETMIARAKEKASGSIQARVGAIDALLPFLAAPARELVRREAIKAAAAAFAEDAEFFTNEVKTKGQRLLGQRLRGERVDPRRLPASSSSSSAPSSSTNAAPSSRTALPSRTSPRQLPAAQERHGVEAAPAKRVRPPSPPLNDTEVQLAKIVLCHPELAPRVALLAPHLDSYELKAFVTRLVDALVRFFDLPPREALSKVAVARTGQLVPLADRVRLDGPDRVLGLSTALSMVEAISRDFLERHVLEARLGAVQPLLAAADADGDNEERKRLLVEQKAIVSALQAFDSPTKPMPALVARVVEALPAPALPASSPLVSVTLPSPVALVPDDVVPAAPIRPITQPPRPSHSGHAGHSGQPSHDDPADPPWAGDLDDDPWAV
jgi:DNA primase catalytic core